MKRPSSDHDIKILNSLIEATLDSADGYSQAADSAVDGRYRDLFLQWANDRRQLATELQGQVRVLGGMPDRTGSFLAAGHRMFLSLRDSVLEGDDSSVIDEVERGEDFIKEMYEEALEDEELSTDIRSAVIRAYSSVKAGHDQARMLKHSLHRSRTVALQMGL